MPVNLQFALNIEDDWPPVGSESLPFDKNNVGYECLSAPLFIKDLSVEDIIEIITEKDGFIEDWRHIERSDRSTIWLLRLGGTPPIEDCLRDLRMLQCNTTGVDQFGCYSVDVPASTSIADVDAILEALDPELVAVAFPSMRHPD